MKTHLIVDLFSEIESDSLTHIKRWSKKPTHHHESVSEHSHDVAAFTAVIVTSMTAALQNKSRQFIWGTDVKITLLEFSLDTMNYSVYHDIDERFTGDITHDVKHKGEHGEEMRKLLQKMVEKMAEEKFSKHPDDYLHRVFKQIYIGDVGSASKFVVKVADWLSMTKFAKREWMMGNKFMEGVYWYGVESLKKLCDEAETKLLKHLQQLHGFDDCYRFWNFDIFETIKNIDYNDEI